MLRNQRNKADVICLEETALATVFHGWNFLAPQSRTTKSRKGALFCLKRGSLCDVLNAHGTWLFLLWSTYTLNRIRLCALFRQRLEDIVRLGPSYLEHLSVIIECGILICHLHLTSIICCTAVWAQACGLERKTSFVIIVQLWFIRRPQLFSVVVGVFVGPVSRYCHFWYRLFGPSQLWQILVRCVLVNTSQYHDAVDFVQDPETEDPQLVAVGRNHSKTMGKS